MANSVKVSPVNLNRELIKRYDYLFPLTKRTFLERALTLALNSPDFFNTVYFNPIFREVK